MPRKRTQNPENYNDIFPSRLRAIMKEKNKTQQDVADAIGKTRQSVSYYADGTSSPDWKTIAGIAQYFDVSADWLLGLSDTRSTDSDIKSVCRYTGLSEEAVKSLHPLGINSTAFEGVKCFIGELFNFPHTVKVFETYVQRSALASARYDLLTFRDGGANYIPISEVLKEYDGDASGLESYLRGLNEDFQREISDDLEHGNSMRIALDDASDLFYDRASGCLRGVLSECIRNMAEKIKKDISK